MEIKIVIDDRLLDFAKRLVTKKRLGAACLLAVVLPVVLLASDVGDYGLYVFQPGTVVSSSEVNQNFERLGEHMDTFESAITVDGDRNVGVGTSDPSAAFDVQGNLSQALSGTVGVVSGQTVVTGSGTKFAMELSVGDAISIGDEVFTVAGITSNTSLTVDTPATTGANNVVAYTDEDLLATRNGAGMGKVVVDKSGNVGIGTGSPISKLQVADGDVYVDTIGSGIVLRSPDGSCFRVTVDNDGTFAHTGITCPVAAHECYQETATQSNSCGAVAGGNYSASGYWNDGLWDEGYTVVDQTGVYVTYVKPANAKGARLKDDRYLWPGTHGIEEHDIPQRCWDAGSTIQLWVHQIQSPTDTRCGPSGQNCLYIDCFDGSSWLNQVGGSGSVAGNPASAFNKIYEEGITWTISQ